MIDSVLTLLSQGLLDLPVWKILVVLLVLTHITIVGVTVYLHRSQAHRGVELHPVVSHFFRFWLWLTTGMVTKEWVAVHRKHHAKCETKEDPHSPQVYGINKLVFDGVDLYRQEALSQETLDRFGHGTPDDWMERNVYTRFSAGGIVIMLVLNILLFGALGLTVWAIQMAWIPFWAAGVINGLGHWWGYRNYESRDASTNLMPWGLIIGGEELHNNHHAFSSSAKFSTKWWEFDIGWFYIRILSMLGLAKVKKVAPQPRINPDKEGIDLDTLRAVITARLHVMAAYGKHVVAPVVRQSACLQSGCGRSLRQIKRLLVRDDSLMDEKARAELAQVLKADAELETIYAFRRRLQEVWGRAAASHDVLTQALREWCAQAEATGIRALQDFARSLRGYGLKPA